MPIFLEAKLDTLPKGYTIFPIAKSIDFKVEILELNKLRLFHASFTPNAPPATTGVKSKSTA